jgi:hypothetical protein
MSSIWDYLPAYNTFFKLFAKVYIAVIIITIIGYWIYTVYQKYIVDSAKPSDTDTTAPKETPDAKLVYILWTGDMASTYMVITRLLAGESVQPVYIDRKSSQSWVKVEKLCLSNLRKLISKRIPAARTQLLPTIYLSDVLDDTSFTDTFRAKFAKLSNKALEPYYALVQWAYYYKITRPILVAWLPLNGKSVQETDLLNKTTIELAMTDKDTGKPIGAKALLKMARESKSSVPYANILHTTCTCWSSTGNNTRCGECKGCNHIKMMQKKLMN